MPTTKSLLELRVERNAALGRDLDSESSPPRARRAISAHSAPISWPLAEWYLGGVLYRIHTPRVILMHARRLATLAVLALSTVSRSAVRAQQTPAPAASRATPSDAELLAIIKQRIAEKRSAGIVIGVLHPDGHTQLVAAGDPGPGRPPLDGNSVFEIGSITKVFTSTVLASLVEEGKVRLDDPVQKYLPASVKIPTLSGKPITLALLSEQRSGLPRLPDNMHPADPTNPYADYSVQQMYDFLSHYQLTRDPGETFEYSNLGVGLLGHVLSLATGRPYEQLVRDRVLEPLGMTHTSIALTPWMRDHLALGHDPQGKVVANWDLPTLAGAGALRSTTLDMLKFVDAYLQPRPGTLGKAMTLAQHERAPAGAMSIGLNWMIAHFGTDTIVWHNGGTGGYRTYVGFVPSRKLGVVVMTNSGGAGADDIGMHLLRPELPLAPPPAPVPQRRAIEVAPDILARYVGRYQLAPEFILDVTVTDGKLFVHPTGQPVLRLWAEAETRFFLKEVDAVITFERDAGGAVTGLVLHQNGQNMPGKRLP
ncbi:MAG: serine hydrolase [Gemmatimonadetes bacterium]|nr:MAG: serine hydrolase [Gemmatimonadota bacterium]